MDIGYSRSGGCPEYFGDSQQDGDSFTSVLIEIHALSLDAERALVFFRGSTFAPPTFIALLPRPTKDKEANKEEEVAMRRVVLFLMLLLITVIPTINAQSVESTIEPTVNIAGPEELRSMIVWGRNVWLGAEY